MKQILKIEASHKISRIDVDGFVQLKTLNDIVEGYIEIIPLHAVFTDLPESLNKTLFVINEEGKLKGLPTTLNIGFDVLVGNVAVVEMEGEEMVGLTKEQIDLLEPVIERLCE